MLWVGWPNFEQIRFQEGEPVLLVKHRTFKLFWCSCACRQFVNFEIQSKYELNGGQFFKFKLHMLSMSGNQH